MTAANWSGGQLALVPGFAIPNGGAGSATNDQTVDADEEYLYFCGNVYWADRATNTVSSAGGKIHWLPGASVTFADAGTNLRIGIQDVDGAAGPAARGVSTNGTLDVYADLVGGTDTITSTTALATAMETGTKSIAHGALVCVTIGLTAWTTTDTVKVRGVALAGAFQRPSTTLQTSGPTQTITTNLPNIILEADDGTRGLLYGTTPFSNLSTQTYKNNDATKEYGNILRFETPVQIDGLWAIVNPSAGTANFTLTLYSDPLAAGAGPTVAASVAVDANSVAASAARLIFLPIAPTTLAANTDYVVAVTPDAAVNISVTFIDEQTGDMAALPLGANCYGVSRGTIGAGTAFASISSGTRRFFCGVSVCGGDDGAGGGGGGPLVGGRLVR